MATGRYWRIWVIDQWNGKALDRRDKYAYSPEQIKGEGIKPSDSANDFYVVVVP